MTMNIWFLSPHEQPHGHTSRTYDYSQELLKRGHQVTVFTNSYCHRTHTERLAVGEKWRLEDIDGIRVVWLRTIHYTGNGLKRGLNMFSFAYRAFEAARALPDKPDVTVGDSVPPTAGWTACKLAKAKGAACVYQVRDAWPIALVYDGGLSRHSPVYYLFRYIEKRMYREAQAICATMPFLHPHVTESGGDPNKITWIPNGVNVARYSPFTAFDGGADRSLTAMYVGAYGFAHDVITIVKAAAILKSRGIDKYKFILVGDGVKRAECERLAAKEGLDNIEFRNSVPKADVPRLQMDSDILIACVTDSQSYRFGINLNKIYDYFASGRPVIFACRTPNDPVADAQSGYSIPPEDPQAMAKALEDYLGLTPEQRIELGKRSRAYAEEHFDVVKLAERMERMLSQASRLKNS